MTHAANRAADCEVSRLASRMGFDLASKYQHFPAVWHGIEEEGESAKLNAWETEPLHNTINSTYFDDQMENSTRLGWCLKLNLRMYIEKNPYNVCVNNFVPLITDTIQEEPMQPAGPAAGRPAVQQAASFVR